MSLRFIVREGKKILQQIRPEVDANGVGFNKWQDVPCEEEKIEPVKPREFVVYRNGPNQYWQASQIISQGDGHEEKHVVIELLPNHVMVNREMLAKAWDEVIYPACHFTKADNSFKFESYIKALGWDEK